MVESNAIALIFSDGASSRMLREVIRVVGCPIVYEASAAGFKADSLAESGARIVVVDLGPNAEADSIFNLLDDDRYRVIVNDAEVTSGLTGWEHARWARHLAAKILGVPAVVDPPRPAEGSVIGAAASAAIAAMKSSTRSELPGVRGPTAKPSPTGAELGIDDWLSEVLQVKDSAGLFAASMPAADVEREEATHLQDARCAGQASERPQTALEPESDALAVPELVGIKPLLEEPARTAADERFDWNIEDVIRDIDDWLPSASAVSSAVVPAGKSRRSSISTEVEPELSASEPQQTVPKKEERAVEKSNYAPRPTVDDRWAPPMEAGWLAPTQPAVSSVPASPIGIAAMKGSRSGHLAHSLDLSPLEEGAMMPLFDVQPSMPDKDMVIDVVPSVSTVSRVVVLCASVGGPEAIRVLLGAIPASHPALFLVVQQVGEEFLDLLSQQLRRATSLRVRSADLGDQLRDGEVIPVSPRQRLVIDRSGRVTLNQRMDEVGPAPMNRVLRDASDQFGEDCIAVVLSGVGSDAADGCRYIAENGGQVCAQAPTSCVSSGMVEQVQQTGVVSFLGTPTELAAHLLLSRR